MVIRRSFITRFRSPRVATTHPKNVDDSNGSQTWFEWAETFRNEVNMMPSFAELSERLLEFQRKELGPGVSDKEINELESTLKVPVKGGYREFLRQVGYGGVEHLELYGLGGPPFLNLGRVTESERSEIGLRLPLYLLPIMNDGFGNLHCLDTRVVGEPPVVFWDHEAECNQIVEVEAEDFISWMWSLH